MIVPASLLALASVDSLQCHNFTSVSMICSWPASPGADRYHITLSDPVHGTMARPFSIRTSAVASIALDDLLPGTRYAVGVRTHPADAPSFVWGWADHLAPITVSLSLIHI